MIGGLFPAEVVTVTAEPRMWDGALYPLYPEEEASLGRVGEKRRRDFTVGRVTAREALARLGVKRYPLVIGEDRLPAWPPGIVGSLSHTDGFCGVAVARAGAIVSLGLDVEQATPLSAEITTHICTEAELAWARLRECPSPCGWPKLIFSAKESLYKCYYPVARRMLGFHDVEMAPGDQEGSLVGRLPAGGSDALGGLALMRGRFAFSDSHVAAGFALTADEITSSRRSPSR